ncbi:hypothetical protein [Pseudomonas sp. KCJK9016]|uniref:hypothetical protein n=1 Tax=Pseudomonas sp. KCJK9016 TaxID=3344556 RepID=UPI003905C42E
MFKHIPLVKTALLGLAVCGASQASAVEAFGNTYSAVAPVSAAQAQIVVFRPATLDSSTEAANVYVDHEFHAALLPGGYSSFCVPAGKHALNASLHDEPQYRGKTEGGEPVSLAGGLTYFLQVGEGVQQPAMFVRQDDAEHLLVNMRQQIQALSRASSVQACLYQQQDGIAQ